MKTNLQRQLDWMPGWDRRDPDPSKNYGIHGMEMRFLVSGKLGTIQFVLYTNWMIASVRSEWNDMERVPRFLNAPLPSDIGYHSRVPRYAGQNPMFNSKLIRKPNKEIVMPDGEPMTIPDFVLDKEFLPRPCEYLNGDPCFYDGSSLNAIKYFDVLVEEGITALWEKLEDYYIMTLGGEFGWIRHFYIFQDITLPPPTEDAIPKQEEAIVKWFYIYRHYNGGWEKSELFEDMWAAVWSKIKVHSRIYYRKADIFISEKLYNAYASLKSQIRRISSRYIQK